MPWLLPSCPRRAAGACAAALIAAACQVAPPAATVDPAGEVRPPVAASIDWAGVPDCLARLRLLEHAALTDRLPDDPAAIPIAVRAAAAPGDASIAAAPDTAWIQADLPVRVLAPHAPPADDVACWIDVGPARDLTADLEEIGREQVRSAYQRSSRSERNPEYEAAQLRVRQAEKRWKDGDLDIIAVGDPMLDLVGLMFGSVVDAFGGRARQTELDEAIATLAKTQRSIERPVWRHYHFERSLLSGRKSALVPIALRGPRGAERQTVVRQREQRTFEVLDGLDPRDRDYEAHDAASMSELELQAWRAAPPAIPVSALIQALIDPTAPPPETDFAPPDVPDPLGPPSRERTVVAAGDAEAPAVETPRRARPSAVPAVPRPAAHPEAASLEALKGAPEPHALLVASPPRPSPAARVAASVRHDRPDVVTLRRDEVDRGLGVYLSPHTVLTTARIVGDANVLEARLGDTLLPALVAARDPARDLALVKLPRPGRAAPLDDDPVGPAPLALLAAGAPAPATQAQLAAPPRPAAGRLQLDLAGSTTAAVGAPLLSEGRLAGLVIAVDGPTAVAASARGIRALLDQLPDSDLILD